jgi:predicted PurR-regulated permease PerM
MAAYLSIDRSAFRRAVALVLPEPRRAGVSEFLDDVESRLGAYVRGQLVVCLAVGVLTGVAYALMGMPHPFLLGALGRVLEIVPVLGPALAAVPAVLVAMKLEGGGMVLSVLGVAATVQILSRT